MQGINLITFVLRKNGINVNNYYIICKYNPIVKFKIVKSLLILNCAIVGGVTLSLFSTSCSKPQTEVDPTDYVGNADGSNWKGYVSGELTCTFDDNNGSATLINGGPYVATDLIIPSKVINNEKIYLMSSIG
jgi:hypothetical protein